MSDWLILAGYTLGWVLCYRKAYVFTADAEARDSDDNVDRMFMAVISMIVAVAWPLVLAGYYAWRLLTPTTLADREREVREREQRVADLERELNIRKDRS